MSKKKKCTIIVIVVVIIIALLGTGAVFAYNYISDLKNSSSGLKVDSNVYMDDESASSAAAEKVSSINVNMYKTLKLTQGSDGKWTLELGLENGNDHQYIVSISVDNKKIYTTDLVPAGGKLDSVVLDSVDLAAGNYEAVAIFTVVSESDNKTVLGSVGTTASLTVIK